MKKIFLSILLFSAIFMTFAQNLIPAGASWKYLDDGSNQGVAWQDLNYDDSSWASGNAQLGYGDGDEATVISYGSSSINKHICYFFRKTINVSNPSVNTALKLSLLRDDGAVVYINGTEVVRSNMPAGNITYTTLAASTVAGSNEDQFFEYTVPSSVLNTGQNIVAVEVHQRSHTSSDVSFDLKLEFDAVNYFEKYPYLLYTGTNDQMKIMWQLTNTQNCVLDYGTDTTYASGSVNTSEYITDHQHKVTLTGLTPDQKYYYRVSDASGSIFTGSFQTAPPDNATNLTFFAYGDTRTNPDDHNQVAEQVMLDINQNNLKQTFILNSGDLVSNGDIDNKWQTEFFNHQYTHINDMLGNLPFLAALGNHEGQGILFSKYFEYPFYTTNAYYYSFDYGPVHVIIIDTETSFSQGSAQYNWIVNDLSTSNKVWKIAVFHRPGWSAGGHSNNTAVQNYLQPLFAQYNVSFVINGHNHYYSRAVVNGIEHITTGGGGAPLYNPNDTRPNIVTIDQSNHYCKLEITGNTLHFSAIRSNGSLIEQFDKQAPATGIENHILNNNWQIFRNNGYIIVDTKNQIRGVLELYDYLGRLVSKKTIKNSKTRFTINNTGVYFVRNILNDKFEVKKVVGIH